MQMRFVKACALLLAGGVLASTPLLAPARAPAHGADLRLGDRLGAARAEEGASVWDEAMTSRLRLIAAQTGAMPPPGETAFQAGIEINLEPKWKTYWSSPGDSGIAPMFDFSHSRNVAEVSVAYPMPHRFDLPGDISFGYEDQVVFPLTVTPRDPDLPVTLAAHVIYGACEELCIPVQAGVALTLPARSGGSTQFAGLIAQWRSMVPAEHAATIDDVAAVTRDGVEWLRVDVSTPQYLTAPMLIAEPLGGETAVYLGPPQAALDGTSARFLFPTKPLKNSPGLAVTGGRFKLTLADQARMAGPSGKMMPSWAQQFEVHLPPADKAAGH